MPEFIASYLCGFPTLTRALGVRGQLSWECALFLFIYLAVPRGLRDLSDQGSNPGPLHWEH